MSKEKLFYCDFASYAKRSRVFVSMSSPSSRARTRPTVGYSITSSAIESKAGESVRPSCFAVLRLMTK
jgi:hypothetical protein